MLEYFTGEKPVDGEISDDPKSVGYSLITPVGVTVGKFDVTKVGNDDGSKVDMIGASVGVQDCIGKVPILLVLHGHILL